METNQVIQERAGAPLAVEAEVLHVGRTIVRISNMLSMEECEALVSFAEGIGFTDAPITTAFGFVMMPDVRDNTRVMIDDPVRAEELWRRLSPFVPQHRSSAHSDRGGWIATGLNERLRFYRYDPGQRFDWHRDGAFVRSDRERSHLTLLVYLNEDFEGGSTELDVGDSLDIAPRRGGALVFAHHVRHQGSRVTRGRKYVLRSDVMYRHSDTLR